MYSYEEAPPPYPGTTGNTATNIITSKSDYNGVATYEIALNGAMARKLFLDY